MSYIKIFQKKKNGKLRIEKSIMKYGKTKPNFK